MRQEIIGLPFSGTGLPGLSLTKGRETNVCVFASIHSWELEDFFEAKFYCPLALADDTSIFRLGIRQDTGLIFSRAVLHAPFPYHIKGR